MSDTQLHDSATPDTTAPGEILRRQREALGIALVDAAHALNLRPAVIEGLELDNYAEIPVSAYRRGYLRAYAKYLNLDERLVLEAYQARNGSAEVERNITPVSVTRPPSKIGAWLFKLVTLLVIVGLIAVTVIWWQSRGGSEPPNMGSTASMEEQQAPPSSPEPAPIHEPVVTSPPALTQEAPTAQQALEISDAATQAALQIALAATASTNEEGVEEESVAEEPAAETPSVPPANTLELTFNEQSWTEIFDANNQRIFVGLQAPDTTASVEGEPPFRLTIGNATGVELRYQGNVIDLSQRAGANNVARFTLGE